MFKPFSLFIGLRYVKAKRRNHYISGISLISILCFAIGVAALIAVLSVMNGFDEQIRNRIFSMAPQATISTFSNVLPDWPVVASNLQSEQHIQSMAPFITGQGMLAANGQVHATLVYGILPEKERFISDLAAKMDAGQLDDLTAGEFTILLGSELANNLGVTQGDKVTLLTPTAALTPFGVIPRYKRFTVAGIFTMGGGFGFDNSYAYIHLRDAQKLYQVASDSVTGLRLKLDDLYMAPQVTKELSEKLPINYLISNWTKDYGAFFQAIALEKTIMFFILLLIIVVAAFSLLSSLYMVVADKQADIAIMKTMGATPKTILAIFIVQGTLLGIIGTALGLILGVVLALNITDLADYLQQLFQVNLLSSNVYYVDFLPSKLVLQDAILVCTVALLISVIATLLPAWRASRCQPVEVLRYE